MKLNVAGKDYYVDFEHSPEKVTPYGVGETFCCLRENSKARPMAVGISYCSWADTYNKRKGRKAAFTRMLAFISAINSNFGREEREKAWLEYFSQMPGDLKV